MMIMKPIVFFLFILFFSNDFVFCMKSENDNSFCKNDSCDIQNLVKIQNNIDSLTEVEIKNFLSMFDGRCINNVEYSEFSNEILYFILSHNKVNLLIKVLSKSKKLLVKEVMEAIENPINDQIDLSKTYENVKKARGCKKTQGMILKSINIAKSKM